MIDAATMSAVVLFFGGFLLSAVSYGFFYFRAMTLARQLEPEHATVSAHGMWWWYAVPFANLWKPFEGVMQVWRALRTHAGLTRPCHGCSASGGQSGWAVHSW